MEAPHKLHLAKTLTEVKFANLRKEYAKLNFRDQYTEPCSASLLDALLKEVPLYKESSPFGASWIPHAITDTTLLTSWREASVLESNPDVVRASLGATLEWLNALSFPDAMMFKFLLARDWDQESATERFLAFRKLIIEYDLTFNGNHPDVQLGFSLGALHMSCPTEPKEGRPVIAILPQKFDWEKITTAKMRRAAFYGQLVVCHSTPIAQIKGVVLTNNMANLGYSNVNTEMASFMSTAMSKCLPLRISVGYIANQPWIFGTVVWPIMKRGFSDKIRDRLHVIGEDYKLVLEALPIEIIPRGMGGERVLDGQEGMHQALRCLDLSQHRQKHELMVAQRKVEAVAEAQ